MACLPSPSGVGIGNCGNSGYDGDDITPDPGADPIAYAALLGALYPASDPNIGDTFLDLGGGVCVYPVSGTGIGPISGSIPIPCPDRVTNLDSTKPIWMVLFEIRCCSDSVGGVTVDVQANTFLGLQSDGITPSSYVNPGPFSFSGMQAWFRTNPATGLAWTVDDLFGTSPVSFNLQVSVGDIEIGSALLTVFFGPATASPEIILLEDPLDPPTEEEIDGGIEFDGDPVIVESADASGIYTLVSGQKFDIIYTRTVNPDDTEDVQIPDPFIRSAFLGG